jgi:selenocysteine lyase/cysteine desulfurase
MTFANARSRFPMLERIAYLNAGTSGPLARQTVDAVAAQQALDLAEGRAGKAYQERGVELRARLRQLLAALLNVDAGQIALTASTTDGCNIVLAGLELGSEDEIVTTTDEHFGLLGPLHASGARVVVVQPDPDRIVAAVTPRTRLLALSHVLWTTGQILPVHELKRRTGLPILVDGAQSVCAIPVDAGGLDYYTVSGQKWPCGPDATGALVVADPDRLRVARPSFFAQISHERDGTFVPREGAERFQPNWLPLASVVGLTAALTDLPPWRFEHASRQAERLRDRLSTSAEVVTPTERATLVSFRPGGEEPAVVVWRLAEQGVIVRELPGRNLVRASVGWWTSDDDLDRLAAGLAA